MKARLDSDKTAKPLTEIVAVMPPDGSGIGKLGTVHTGQATHYVARPTAESGALTGKVRRAEYLRIKREANDKRRAERRLPTRHALIIRGLIVAQMLPPPGVDGITEDERRAVRNKLKAMRRAHRS